MLKLDLESLHILYCAILMFILKLLNLQIILELFQIMMKFK